MVCDIDLRKWAGKCVRDRDMRRVSEIQREIEKETERETEICEE